MSNKESHYRKLENMYHNHRLNSFYNAIIIIKEKEAEITIPIKEDFHHALGAVHGSVYWKALDDAAFFAANSVEQDVFVLTSSYTIYLTKPISTGKLIAKGKLVNKTRSQFIAESILYNENNEEIARGSGVYIRSKTKLSSIKEYNQLGEAKSS